MSELGAPADPRPAFETSCKIDVLSRLVVWHGRLFGLQPLTLSIGNQVALRADLADAMDAVSGLRESDARRLGMISDLKRQLTELRQEES